MDEGLYLVVAGAKSIRSTQASMSLPAIRHHMIRSVNKATICLLCSDRQ